MSPTESALHLRAVVLDGTPAHGTERDVWVRDGRISHERVPGATTVAQRGFLVPSLVDAHCHVGLGPAGPVELEEAREQGHVVAAEGATLIRDCGSPIDTRSLDDDPEMPEIVRAGRHIARPKRYIRGLPIDVDPPEDLPAVVAEEARANPWVKLVGDWIDRDVGDLAPLWPDEVLVDAIAAAHAAGARVTAHVFGEDAVPGLLAAGIDCLEHGSGLTDDTIATMAASGTALVPTMINLENFPSFADAAGERFPRYATHMRELYARGRATIRAAVEAGVPVYAGTDAGGGVAHGRLADEVVALTGVGLSPEGALAAASWAARGWLVRPGLEHGAPADLVVLDEDPRPDATAVQRPQLVLRAGRRLR